MISDNSQFALARALDGKPRATQTAETADGDIRTVEIVMRNERSVQLQALWAGDGERAAVRRIVAGVPTPWPSKLVLTARCLSAGALDVLREHEANWADECGQAHIVNDDLVVIKSVAVAKQPPRFTWSRSAIAVGEAIIANGWDEQIRTVELAQKTGWSPARVSEVLQSFDLKGWTSKRGPQRGPGSGRTLEHPDGLLKAWEPAVAAEQRSIRLGHRLPGSLEAFFQEVLLPLLNQKVRWAATGWLGAQLLAPFATHLPSLQIYVAAEDFFGPLSDVLEQSDLTEVDEGAQVEFFAAPSHVLRLAHQVASISVASPPRVCADLVALGFRAEDAADHLREEVVYVRLLPMDGDGSEQLRRR